MAEPETVEERDGTPIGWIDVGQIPLARMMAHESQNRAPAMAAALMVKEDEDADLVLPRQINRTDQIALVLDQIPSRVGPGRDEHAVLIPAWRLLVADIDLRGPLCK